MGANLIDGFEQYYRPIQGNLVDFFESGLIIFDTNVLLNVLRFSPTARKELLEAIESVASKSFIPHQVAVEYNRNRVKVVADRRSELDNLAEKIDSIRAPVRAVVNTLRGRRIIPAADLAKLEDASKDFMEALEQASSEALEQYDLDPDSLTGVVDEWTGQLNRVLSGRVVEPAPEEIRKADEVEARRRVDEKLAPGFKDSPNGDYLWWAETLRLPELTGRHLLVVSDDAAKGDWRYEERGITAGPHKILVDDALKAGALSLSLLTTGDFLKLVEELGSSSVSVSTIAESERVVSAKTASWTLVGYLELIDALERDGYDDRVEVIRSAAQGGGDIDREEVYRIAGMSEADRSLRQFATPALRHARAIDLSAEDLVKDLSDPLSAFYDGPGKALGYRVPSEFVEFEHVLAFLRERALSKADKSRESSITFPSSITGMLERHILDSAQGSSNDAQLRISRFLSSELRRHQAASLPPEEDGLASEWAGVAAARAVL